MEGLLRLWEGMREVALLEALVVSERLFQFELLRPNPVPERPFFVDVTVDDDVDSSERLLASVVCALYDRGFGDRVFRLALREALLPKPLHVAIVLGQQVSITAVELLDLCLLYTSRCV